MSDKSERRAARSVVAEYREAELGDVVARVGQVVDRNRAGELDAFDVDRAVFQYSRAAKELWKCPPSQRPECFVHPTTACLAYDSAPEPKHRHGVLDLSRVREIVLV